MFRDAYLKLDRADKHIRDAESAVLALKGVYTSSVEVNAQTGGHSIKYACPDLERRLIEIAPITGDALHNLRTALDYAWVAAIEGLNLGVTQRTRFPFSKDAKVLDDTLRELKIDTACPLLFQKLRIEIQPYPAGRFFLYALQDADIMDKHTLLLPVIDYTGASRVSVEDENGIVRTEDSLGHLGSDGVFCIDFAPNVRIKDKGELFVSVLFPEGSPFPEFSIPEELFALAHTTRGVVQTIEALVT